MDEFKRFFIRGLAAVLPTLLTVAVFAWAYRLVDDIMGQHITTGMLKIVSLTGPPDAVDEDEDALIYGEPINEWLDQGHGELTGRRATVEYKIIHNKALSSKNEKIRAKAVHEKNETLWRIAFIKYKLHLIGFLIAIIVVYFVGFFLASFFGRATWRFAENALGRVPLVKDIYPSIKQVTDFLFSESKLEFSGVVAVPYPRKGIWSVGLLTGTPMKAIQEHTKQEMVTVFIPSSPTPVTGYTITVHRDEIIELALSVDEALRFIISAGVIKPDTQLTHEVKQIED